MLAVSIVAVGCLGAGLYQLHGWQLARLSSGLLSLSATREAESRWEEAAIYLDRYLRVHPQDVAVRARLAKVYASGADGADEKMRAVDLHYRALGAGPEPDEAGALRARLARLLLETGRFAEAEREAGKVNEKHADYPEACRALALALFAQWENGALASAKLEELKLLARAEQARRLNPADELLAEVTAAFYRDHANVVAAEMPELGEADRLQRADGCLDHLVSANPDTAKVYLARFRYRARYQLPGGDADIAKALELAPADQQVLLTAAVAALRDAAEGKANGQEQAFVTEKYRQSQSLFEKLIASDATTAVPDAYLGLGDAQLGQDHLDTALATWRSGLKRFSQPTTLIALHARLAEALMQADRAAEAADSLDAIDKLVGSLGKSVARDERLALMQSRDLRRASWHLARDNAEAAVPLLQDVVARQASGTSGNTAAAAAWNLLGRANARLGQWSEAAVAFDRAAPLDPKSSAIRLAAAYAWLQVGRPELAVDRAEQALAGQPSIDALLLLATAEFERQLALPAKQRAWDRLERSLAALEQDPASQKLVAPWRIDFLRADYAVIRARQDGDEIRGRNEAIAIIERAEPKYADTADFWRQAATAYQRLSVDASADRALSRFGELETQAVEQAVLKAKLAMLRKDTGLARRVLEDAFESAAAGEQSKLRRELVQVALAQGDRALAEQLLSAEARQRPRDVQLLRMGCELALERKDRQAAARWQAQLNAAGSLGAWWARYFRAADLYSSATNADDPALQEALDELAKLTIMRPHWPMPYTLRGMIELRMGRQAQAVESLEQAVQLGERKLAVFEQLIGLLDHSKDTEKVERYLSRLESYMPFSQRLTEVATSQELRRDNPEQAVEIARAAAVKRPGDAFAHLWLARVLLVNKQTAEAEAEFKQALALEPRDVRTWNGLFSFYVRTGATEKARQTLEELRTKANLSGADLSFVVAQGYEMLGEWDSARQQYEAATSAAPERAIIHIRLASVYLRSDPRKAEASLRQALQAEPDSAIARRMLAALLAARGDEAEMREVDQLLSKTDAASSTVAVEDRRLNALLLAQYGDASQRLRAVQILEAVVSDSSQSVPGDRLVLAQLYELQARSTADEDDAIAKRHAAREQLLSVATAAGAEPGHLAALIDFFVRNGQPAEAATWLEKLESLLKSRGKDEPVSLAQFIELSLRAGSGQRCEPWIKRLIACDTDPLRPLALEARWLASQKREAEVATLVESKAEQVLVAAKDDAHRGRLARLIGDVYFAAQQPAHAERWYRTAAGHDPAQFPSLAGSLARDGKHAEVVRLCRDEAQRDRSSRPAVVLAAVLAEAAIPQELNDQIDAFLSAALQQHAADADLLYAVATLRAIQGRYDEAQTHYRALLRIQPKNIRALNNLAMVLAEIPDQREESLALIDRAIDIAGEQPGLLDTKGTILVYQGQFQEAVRWLEAAAREAGADARHRFHLAAAYHGVGQAAKASEHLRLALEQDLEKQVLTATDRRLLADLKASLVPPKTR